MKSMADLKKEMIKKYGTSGNIYSNFPIGTKVKVITPCQDFHFFYGETGKVIKNTGGYLSIIVEFDIPRKFEDGMVQETFNFNPEDLLIIGKAIEAKCPYCGKSNLDKV